MVAEVKRVINQHTFDGPYGVCIKCGVSRREAVGTQTIAGVECVEEFPVEISSRIQTAMEARRDKFYLELKKDVSDLLKSGHLDENGIIHIIDIWGDE